MGMGTRKSFSPVIRATAERFDSKSPTICWRSPSWMRKKRTAATSEYRWPPFVYPQDRSLAWVAYLISTTKTSPRQLVPTVQVLAPCSEPRLPIQSDEKMKNLPSCETLPIPYCVLKFCDWVVMKL
jgi:hypothetical protein